MSYLQTARQFWSSRREYPCYGNIKQRRYHEILYVINKTGFSPVDTLVDVGCGDGSFVKCLDCLLQISKIYCYDYSTSLMENISDTKIIKSFFDCNDVSMFGCLPSCQILMFGGVINFMFEDQLVVDLLRHFKAQHIFIRSPCTMRDSNHQIDTFSEQLKQDYSCIYRTVKNTEELIVSSGLRIIDQSRIYPDDIESQFDTRQYMFYCTNAKVRNV